MALAVPIGSGSKSRESASFAKKPLIAKSPVAGSIVKPVAPSNKALPIPKAFTKFPEASYLETKISPLALPPPVSDKLKILGAPAAGLKSMFCPLKIPVT